MWNVSMYVSCDYCDRNNNNNNNYFSANLGEDLQCNSNCTLIPEINNATWPATLGRGEPTHSECTHNTQSNVSRKMATNKIIKIYKIYCLCMVIKSERATARELAKYEEIQIRNVWINGEHTSCVGGTRQPNRTEQNSSRGQIRIKPSGSRLCAVSWAFVV